MRFSKCVSVCLFVLSLVLFPSSIVAQQGTTSIVGDVTDPQGATVATAKVTATDASSGVSRQTETDAAGHFQFLSLQPGTYVLHVELQGFRSVTTGNIEALVSTTQKVNIKLELGEVSQTVTVTEGAVAAVNTTDATIGNAFDSKQILALPFEGRDAAAVLSLQPGIAFIGTNVDDRFDTRNGAVNGGRSDQANITLDGVDNNDQLLGTAFQGALRSTLDSIEEFRVTTAGANADAGRSSGGQVTLITKSGTNTFHGSLFEQHRPTNMAANDWFNKHNELKAGQPNTRPKFLRNTFGGALGGPIKKDRLFFFYTYEGQRISEGSQVSRSVPTASLRDGVIFYPCATPAQCPAGNFVTGQSGTKYPVPAGQFGVGPAQIAQMDPNCTALGSCPQGKGVDPSILATLNKYPSATPGAGSCTFFDGFNNVGCDAFSSPTPTRHNTNIAKLDYNINRSGTHRVFLRGNYQVDSAADVQQFLGGSPINLTRDTSRALAAGYTAVLSRTIVNNFRYGFTRESRSNQGLETTPLVLFRVIDDLVPATSTRAFQFPVHNWVDDLTWTRGKHTLQFGTNLRLINNIRSSNATSFNTATLNPGFLVAEPAGNGISLDPGAFGFPVVDPNNTSAYNNAVSTLVGFVTQGNASYNFTKNGAVLPQGTPVQRHFRAWETDWYVQDVWHLRSNLTVTAGLRYTILQPPYETTGTQAAPNISLHDFVDARARAMSAGQTFNPAFTFNLSGQANGKKPYWAYDYKDLGPRLSIAYAPNYSSGLLGKIFGSGGKSSIRAGFGIVYDHFGESIVNTFDQTGTFGLTTAIGNPTNQSVDGGARFISTTNIPTSSPDGVVLPPAPKGGFPATPPSSLQLFSGLGLDDKLKTPYSELVDFAITRELPGGFVFEAAYVGRFAHRLLEQRDFAMPLDLKDPKSGMDYFKAAKIFADETNAHTPAQNIQPVPFFENFFPGAAGVNGSTCGNGAPGHGGAPGNGALANPTPTQSLYELFYCQTGPGTFGQSNALFIIDSACFPACATINGVTTPNAFYPPQFSTLYGWSSFGKSGYNAGQFTLRSKPTHGVQFDFNYTYSKSLDTGSDAERVPTFGGISGAIVNTWAPNQLFGPSDFDIRHSINSNWLADLPFGKGKRFGSNWNRAVDTVIGGWQVTGLLRWSTGLPFSVSNAFPGGTGPFPTDFQLPGNATLIGAKPSTGLAADKNGDPNVFTQGGATAGSAFRFDFAGESGQRNILRGQGFFGTDAGVNKTFRITERQSLRFSAYAFNLFNSVRFDANSILNSFPVASTFGKYQSTLTTSRRLEFVLRYQF
jgi:Carboxypeptidase regulatory-like domain